MQNNFYQTRPEIKQWLEKMQIDHYELAPDLSVSVEGDVNLKGQQLDYLPVQFSVVTGRFDCSSNNLSSLMGSPSIVGEGFNCAFNQLTTLEGAPREVTTRFSCTDNLLTTLAGSPEWVGASVLCSRNPLETLESNFTYIGMSFYAHAIPRLPSLKGLKGTVKGSLEFGETWLQSIENLECVFGGKFQNSFSALLPVIPGLEEKTMTVNNAHLIELDYETLSRLSLNQVLQNQLSEKPSSRSRLKL